ncbi:13375_t:CDS:2 [Ambispora leptoticha]|uniref:13375_t:CDS:1 n=1 Tax=Ambispora leptoticha TaxID=144679 RepID=A0A9N8VF34_9GLOM|nr:13375_t:CDS:2 [Ambispora leptoticha]
MSSTSKDEEYAQGRVPPPILTIDINKNSEEDCISDSSSFLIDDSAKKHSVLDAFITRIGMGKFQKQLLVLCGFGWLADNMWLQCIAVILPRVQVHFNVSDRYIGALSSSVFIGMMFGALFWGVLSDTNGRKQAFNLTLAVTALFGVFSSLAQSFVQLCVMLLLLGFGVGGNMPVDGALFLEFIPKEQQYLLTFLSVFFSFGAVLSSSMAYVILPPYSCPETSDKMENCDVNTQNNGWRYMLAILGSLTFLMLLARLLLFRLQESPKYLLTNNRKHDAVLVLRKIARINGNPMQIHVSDFPTTPDPHNNATSISSSPQNVINDSSPFLVAFSYEDKYEFRSNPISYTKFHVSAKLHSVRPLFTPKWIRTTLLVWAIWGLVGYAYTTFNVFLPKYLESLGIEDERTQNQDDNLMKEALRDYLIYSICGVPGSVVGAYLIESALGRKGSMAIATFGTSFAVFLFTTVRSSTSIILSSAMVSFLATLNYAVIYGYTPEVFEVKLRGTACGISSAIGRIAGIIAPVITGALLAINISLPLFVSAILFGLAGVSMVLLPIETRGRQA